MPPHCDSMDGPVVKAAVRALETGDVGLALPFAPKDAEEEIRSAFQKVMSIRGLDERVKEIADLFFFETVVRLHRAGEGAGFNGLKPAGLDHGPVVPVAAKAIETEEPDELLELMSSAVRETVSDRFGHVMGLKLSASDGLDNARAYTSAMLGLQVYCHKLYMQLKSPDHSHHE